MFFFKQVNVLKLMFQQSGLTSCHQHSVFLDEGHSEILVRMDNEDSDKNEPVALQHKMDKCNAEVLKISCPQ